MLGLEHPIPGISVRLLALEATDPFINFGASVLRRGALTKNKRAI